MGLGDLTEDLGIMFSRVGIQGDHLAAQVALEDGDHRFGSDAQRTTDELIFTVASRRLEVHVDVRPEAPDQALTEGPRRSARRVAGRLAKRADNRSSHPPSARA